MHLSRFQAAAVHRLIPISSHHLPLPALTHLATLRGGLFFLAGHIRAAFTATSDTILNQVLMGATPLGYTA